MSKLASELFLGITASLVVLILSFIVLRYKGWKRYSVAIALAMLAGIATWGSSDLSERLRQPASPDPPPTPSAIEIDAPRNPIAVAPDKHTSCAQFRNGNFAQDRNRELRRLCRGNVTQVDVAPELGNEFTLVCGTLGKTCVGVLDWEGTFFPCSAVTRGARRDGTRAALCR